MTHMKSKFSFNLELALESTKRPYKNHNFLDTPSGIYDCGDGYEDNTHFFYQMCSVCSQQNKFT